MAQLAALWRELSEIDRLIEDEDALPLAANF